MTARDDAVLTDEAGAVGEESDLEVADGKDLTGSFARPPAH